LNLLSVTSEWLEYAEHDYRTAQVLYSLPNPPVEIIAYHCQQTIEKYLKAYLIQFEKEYPRTHDLSVLNRKILSFDTDFESISEFCEKLTPFGTVTRYPDSGMQIDVKHLVKIQEWTSKIRQYVSKRLELLDQ